MIDPNVKCERPTVWGRGIAVCGTCGPCLASKGALEAYRQATEPKPKVVGEEIVEWLLGLEGGLERVIRGEVPSTTSERRDLQARRGIYEGIADDIKRKWPALFAVAESSCAREGGSDGR